MDDHNIRAFRRMFVYVWPQWPRVVVVVFMSFTIAALFSLSFVTIIPLLKVMMGEEGLHGWIDRKTSDARYGMDFYVPDVTDFMQGTNGIAFYLWVTDVDSDSWAAKAGLKAGDKIIGVGKHLRTGEQEKVSAAILLEELATAPPDTDIKVQFLRDDGAGGVEPYETVLETAEPTNRLAAYKAGLYALGQRLVARLPRDQTVQSKQQAIIFIIIVMGFVTTARCIGRFSQSYLAEKIVQVAVSKLRRVTFAHVMQMPVGFFAANGTSDTISRIVGDTASMGNGVKIVLGKALREPMAAFFCLAAAFTISWQLTLIFLTAAPLTIYMFGLLGKKIRKGTKRSLISAAVMLGKLQGAINGLSVVKVYNRQDHETQAYATVNKRFLRQVLRIAKVDAATDPLMEVLGMVAGSAALLVGAHWVFSPGKNIEASEFLALLVLLGTSAEAIRKVSDVWNKLQAANAAAERVFAVLDQPLEYEAPDAIELAPLRHKIEFRNVVFQYPGSPKPMLKGVNLTVQAGQTIAVVGPNGSGKTTLINLIPRFYDVTDGAVLIDGQDIRKATLKSLRAQIGMVTQNVVTFNDTIAANIAYGREGATDEEIIQAAKRAYCHEFIEPLPKGYETVIGEHGTGLSGGQLQRIVIARAIVKDPAILIFDEAMSQVDADSEAKIHKALEELMGGRTCFVIAHRFSTVISADLIVVMENGRIAALGTHEELIESSSLYRSLYETQLMVPES
ncbi:MAG TPA: ABC transporter transmembrane domain-containing protein [Anaerohalosphaeraceae bacterium]|nr:ABC transporter transmembrane domain-containing protein [Anaerohalosphaeraceae bacterium]HRT50824.1 ABC transporter transmembrane domain-containing protein [Anaerohalosphaeraceae bacterium]HRT86738.1 ABC transporter transmembrane domain-containing protein [Anaerohalosphaeraceae bacterium]